MRFWNAFASACLGLLVCAATTIAQESPLDRLLTSFGSLSALECHFREEKQIALLSTPIVSEGTLHYARPRTLVRRTLRPSSQVVLVEGDSLRMREGSRVETIDLAAQPVVRSFVETFGQLLAGDRRALDRTYRIEFTPQGNEWDMALVPKASPLDRFLAKIEFHGAGTALSRMVLREVSGDITTTTFSEVVLNRSLSAEDRARVFSLR